MGRAPCCDKAIVKRGPWSPEEDAKLREYIEKYGTGGNWIALPHKAGLKRCGKSCRLRWLNYLRPNIKHGDFSNEEDGIICGLFANIGSRWSVIAAQLPGRTDNDIKNYWNTKLRKKMFGMQKDHETKHRRSQHDSTILKKPPLEKRIENEPSTLSFENVHDPSSSFMNPQDQKQIKQHDQNKGTRENSSEITNLNYIWPDWLSPYADQSAPLVSTSAFGGDQSCTTSEGSYQHQPAGFLKNSDSMIIPSEMVLETMNLESLLMPPKTMGSWNSYGLPYGGGNNGGFQMPCPPKNLFSECELESKPFSGQDQFNNFLLGTALSSSNLSHLVSQDTLMY